MKNIIKLSVLAFMLIIVGGSCKKLKRPALGNYPQDANPPGGPLKFFTAFDGTTANPLMNAVDSIRANFPSVNPSPDQVLKVKVCRVLIKKHSLSLCQ